MKKAILFSAIIFYTNIFVTKAQTKYFIFTQYDSLASCYNGYDERIFYCLLNNNNHFKSGKYFVLRDTNVTKDDNNLLNLNFLIEFNINDSGKLCNEYTLFSPLHDKILKRYYFCNCELNSVNQDYYYYDENKKRIKIKNTNKQYLNNP